MDVSILKFQLCVRFSQALVLVTCAASPYLLFARQSANIERVFLDGNMRSTVHSGAVRALDFDFRYVRTPCNQCLFVCF